MSGSRAHWELTLPAPARRCSFAIQPAGENSTLLATASRCPCMRGRSVSFRSVDKIRPAEPYFYVALQHTRDVGLHGNSRSPYSLAGCRPWPGKDSMLYRGSAKLGNASQPRTHRSQCSHHWRCPLHDHTYHQTPECSHLRVVHALVSAAGVVAMIRPSRRPTAAAIVDSSGLECLLKSQAADSVAIQSVTPSSFCVSFFSVTARYNELQGKACVTTQ